MNWESLLQTVKTVFEEALPWHKTIADFTSDEVLVNGSKFLALPDNTSKLLTESLLDRRKEIIYRDLFQFKKFLHDIDDLFVTYPSVYRITYGYSVGDNDSDRLKVVLIHKIKMTYERGYNPPISNYKAELAQIAEKVFEEYFRLSNEGSAVIYNFPEQKNGEYVESEVKSFLLNHAIYPIFYQAIHYTDYLRYLTKIKDTTEGAETDDEDLPASGQIHWAGTPGEFGAIMQELIDKGYIESGKTKKSTIRMLHKHFNIKKENGAAVDFAYLHKCFYERKKEYPPGKELKIEKSDNYGK